MEENKSKKSEGVSLVVLTIIVILIIALAVSITYILKTSKQEITVNNSEKTINELRAEVANLRNEIAEKDKNQYEKIKGEYSGTIKVYNESAETEIPCYYNLSLKEDGTFLYNISNDMGGGFCGNYIINGTELILNKLFEYGSDVGLYIKEGQVKLKINSDGTISDENNDFLGLPVKDILLERKSIQVKSSLKNQINTAALGNLIFAEK